MPEDLPSTYRATATSDTIHGHPPCVIGIETSGVLLFLGEKIRSDPTNPNFQKTVIRVFGRVSISGKLAFCIDTLRIGPRGPDHLYTSTRKDEWYTEEDYVGKHQVLWDQYGIRPLFRSTIIGNEVPNEVEGGEEEEEKWNICTNDGALKLDYIRSYCPLEGL